MYQPAVPGPPYCTVLAVAIGSSVWRSGLRCPNRSLILKRATAAQKGATPSRFSRVAYAGRAAAKGRSGSQSRKSLLINASPPRLLIRESEGGLATAVSALKIAAAADDLEQAFRTHNASVLRAAFRITGSLADAEDAAQAVFLRLLRGELDRSRISDIGSYLRRAAVNAALDILRSRNGWRQIPIENAASFPSDSELRPDRAMSSAEIRSRLRQALAKLHPSAAEMFALRYLEGLDHRSIAQVMGRSQAVVAVTLHRARSRLRKELRRFAK